MIAALILLNTCRTLRTFPSIRKDPVRCLTFVHALLNPLAELRAGGRIVRLFATLEAEAMIARATHCRDTTTHRDLLAPRSGAILHVLGLLDEVAYEVQVVLR